MKKIILTLSFLYSTYSLAAPSGQALCTDAAGKYQFTIGTFAAVGDGGILKIEGQSFAVKVEAGEGYGDLVSQIQLFCPCEPVDGAKVALVKWEITEGDRSEPNTIKMSFINKTTTDITMTCQSVDYKAGSEQD